MKLTAVCGTQTFVAQGTKGSRAELYGALAFLLPTVLTLPGCNSTRSDLDVPPPPRASTSSVSQPEAAPPPSSPRTSRPPKPETSAEAAAQMGRYEDTEPVSWRLSELSDVAPAGPASATPSGVAMVT